MPFDIFSGDSGLKDDYDGTIESALFVQAESGNYQAQLVISADDGEEVIVRLGVGKGWNSFDGGESLTGASPQAKFNTRTAYQRFIASCMKAGAQDEMRERSEKLYNGLGPTFANFWVGLRFHFDIVMDLDAQTRNDETGKWEKIEGGRPVTTPTKYLGVGNVSGSHQPTLMDAADLDALTEIAKGSADYAAFTQAVMQASDGNGQPMIKNRQVVEKMADKGWYEGIKVNA